MKDWFRRCRGEQAVAAVVPERKAWSALGTESDVAARRSQAGPSEHRAGRAGISPGRHYLAETRVSAEPKSTSPHVGGELKEESSPASFAAGDDENHCFQTAAR